MSESTRHRLFLAAIAALVFFVNLGGSHLWDVDEAIFSQSAAEMFQRGDYVVPYFNGELFPDKPALTYWLMMSAYRVFGVGEFGARFWSALLSVGSVLLTHRIGCRLFSPGVGLWAGLILATNISFDIIARAATPDAALIFFTTLAICLFIRVIDRPAFAISPPENGTGSEQHPANPGTGGGREVPVPIFQRETDLSIEPTWKNFALAYAAMGVATLAKGPVGVVLPTAVFGLFFLITRGANTLVGLPAVSAGQGRWAWMAKLLDGAVRTASPRHIFQTILSLRPALAILVVLAVAGPWYVLVGLRTDWQWPAQFFGVHNFGRFLNAMDNHKGPIFYYVGIVLVLFFPWSIVMLGTLSELVRQSARTMHRRQGAILIACWIAVYFGFFSLCSTKLPSYVVPMYPALAIATALFLEALGLPARIGSSRVALDCLFNSDPRRAGPGGGGTAGGGPVARRRRSLIARRTVTCRAARAGRPGPPHRRAAVLVLHLAGSGPSIDPHARFDCGSVYPVAVRRFGRSVRSLPDGAAIHCRDRQPHLGRASRFDVPLFSPQHGLLWPSAGRKIARGGRRRPVLCHASD